MTRSRAYSPGFDRRALASPCPFTTPGLGAGIRAPGREISPLVLNDRDDGGDPMLVDDFGEYNGLDGHEPDGEPAAPPMSTGGDVESEDSESDGVEYHPIVNGMISYIPLSKIILISSV